MEVVFSMIPNHVRFLRIPLYKLIYIENIDGFSGLKDSEIKQFYIDYTSDEVENIMNALAWGVENHDFDFRSLLPDLRHSNDTIYRYIVKLQKQIQKEHDKRVEI
jgi:hypothetical protein